MAAKLVIASQRKEGISPLSLSWYNLHVVIPQSGNRKGVNIMCDIITAFLVSVMASIAAYYICKWLDRNDNDDN